MKVRFFRKGRENTGISSPLVDFQSTDSVQTVFMKKTLCAGKKEMCDPLLHAHALTLSLSFSHTHTNTHPHTNTHLLSHSLPGCDVKHKDKESVRGNLKGPNLSSTPKFSNKLYFTDHENAQLGNFLGAD